MQENRSDDAGRDGDHDVPAVMFAPFIAVTGAAQMVLPIIDHRRAVPIVVSHALSAAIVMLSAPIRTPARMVASVGLGEGGACGRTCEGRDRQRAQERAP